MEWLLSEGIHPTRMTYNTLIKASRVNPKRGVHWYNAMRAAGIEPNIQTFNKLIEIFSERGDMVAATHWFDVACVTPNITLDEAIFTTMLKNFSGRPEHAEQWLDKMDAHGFQPSLHLYTKLIDIYAQSGQPVKAERYFNVALAAGLVPDSFTYGILIRANAVQPDRAEQ
jgi:pentatricopeptide repeat protein